MNFGSVATGSTATHTFTVNNTGGVPATALADAGGLAAPYTFLGGAYPGTGGTCAATLLNGANCTIVVEYAPTATGVQTDTIDLSYNDGAGAQNSTRDLTGTGAAPAVLSISDAPTYDYGTIAVGGTSNYTFTVSNTGGIPATLLTGGAFGADFRFLGGAYPGTGGTCTGTLANGANCTVVVEFVPSATGALADTLTINYNDGRCGSSGDASGARNRCGSGIADNFRWPDF